ncbi:hypothetical protein MUK42_00949 [Musa troglodytarum]|uniref:Uncharacterized protein n=1 Tax=Musa troglodytarum TaxID=320322 RepID=A0A9E7K103_9LILI|nr:hypothetical protein MUK42_00949 [Musa troglodytarum]
MATFVFGIDRHPSTSTCALIGGSVGHRGTCPWLPTSVRDRIRAGWFAEVYNMFLFKTFLRTPRLFPPWNLWPNRFPSDRSPCPCFRRGTAQRSVCRRSRSFSFVASGRGIFFDLFHIASYSSNSAIARSLSTAPK